MPTTIASTIGTDKYEQIRGILFAAFPGRGEPVPDETVDAVVRALWHGPSARAADYGVARPPSSSLPATAALPAPDGDFTYYLGAATHHRVRKMSSTQPFASEFVGYLPLVRVPVPATLAGMGNNPQLNTAIGTIFWSADHLVGSVELIADKFSDDAHLGYTPARVDVITPARRDGARFGAIALYLGYRNADDDAPSFYIFEAGRATGQPEMLYFAPTMEYRITSLSGYNPTPFSEPDDTYNGYLTMVSDAPDEPAQMVVVSNMPSLPFYITVTVDYQQVSTPPGTLPATIILDAAERVATIAQAMGVPSGEPLEDLLAALGKLLPWIILPGTTPTT